MKRHHIWNNIGIQKSFDLILSGFAGWFIGLLLCSEDEKRVTHLSVDVWYLDAEFVDTHYEALIQNVTSVMTIADKLHENRKLTWKQYSKITKTTKRTQSTELLKAVKSGGSAVKSAFCEILQEIEPDVIQELQGMK